MDEERVPSLINAGRARQILLDYGLLFVQYSYLGVVCGFRTPRYNRTFDKYIFSRAELRQRRSAEADVARAPARVG